MSSRALVECMLVRFRIKSALLVIIALQADMDPLVRKHCDEILAFRRANDGRKPARSRDASEENRIAVQQAKLKIRCDKPLGTKPSQRQLTPDERRYYEWCMSTAALHADAPDWMDSVRESSEPPCKKRLCSKTAVAAGSSPSLDLPIDIHMRDGMQAQSNEASSADVGANQDTTLSTHKEPPPKKRLHSKTPVAAEGFAMEDADIKGEEARSSKASQVLKGMAQKLTLRGLNIQWPFSQLILTGAKPAEVRTYALDEEHKHIARPGEELWLIETPGPASDANANALVEDAVIGPRPKKAQIVGTTAFSHSARYADLSAFHADFASHRIREGGEKDWTDEKERHAWRVAAARSLVQPIPAPTNKSMTGCRCILWMVRMVRNHVGSERLVVLRAEILYEFLMKLGPRMYHLYSAVHFGWLGWSTVKASSTRFVAPCFGGPVLEWCYDVCCLQKHCRTCCKQPGCIIILTQQGLSTPRAFEVVYGTQDDTSALGDS